MRIAFDRRGIDANVEILEQVVQLRSVLGVSLVCRAVASLTAA